MLGRIHRQFNSLAPAVLMEKLDGRLLLSAGDLDSTFRNNGRFTHDFGFGDDSAYAITVQADGRFLVAGTVRGANGTNDFGVARFLSNGSLDATFGINGMVTTDFGLAGASSDEARAMVIDSSGRIYVAGYANRGTGTGNDFAVARYLSNGSLDDSFGAAGIAVNHFGTNDQALAMALQSDGRLVVTGLFTSDFGTVRYNANGSLDTSFGANGSIRTPVGTGTDSATSVAIRGDGKIFVGGWAQFGSDFDFAVAAYNANGSLDTTFNGSGRVTTNMGTADRATAIALLSDGRFVLAGRSDGNVAVVRYNADGSLDDSFGAGGIATINLFTSNDGANAIVLRSDGSILLAGAVGSNSSSDFAVLRLDSAGALDSNFAVNGLAQTDFSVNYDEAFAMAIGADGRLIVVGSSMTPGGRDFSAARFMIAANVAPVAVITGATTVNEGSTIVLDAGGSSDPDGTIESFEWDFDYDGSIFTVDAAGTSATFSAVNLDGPTSRIVALRVTDNAGESSIVFRTMNVSNVAPAVTIGGMTAGERGKTLTFTADFFDAGSQDTLRLRWEFSDGTVIELDASGSRATINHTFASTGNFTVKVTVLDDDGGSSAAQMSVTINEPQPPPPPPPPPNPQPYQFVADPNNPGKMMLIVDGTAGDDDIRFHRHKRGVEVRYNGRKLGVFNVTSRIVANGFGGDDRIIADGCLNVPVQFFGDAGNDILRGGNRNDTLDGGAGNDRLFGEAGDDLLLGGAGNDTIRGGRGNDTLNGGAGRD
ncbi:hypothetical protein BH09PLA1_BH09PLA1_13920 [soil metagenome]